MLTELPPELEPFRDRLIESGMRPVECPQCRLGWLTRGASDICPPCRKLN